MTSTVTGGPEPRCAASPTDADLTSPASIKHVRGTGPRLVGHSYGWRGRPPTPRTGLDNVVGLVVVAAFAPDKGKRWAR